MSPKCVLCSVTAQHTQPGLMDLIPLLVHQSDRLEGRGIFFFFSVLADDHFPGAPRPLSKEIMFRYKDCD